MKLLIRALQEPEVAKKTEFRFGREGDVNARGSVDTAQFDQTASERAACLLRPRTRTHQEAPPCRRRERHRDLQFRVIAPARLCVSFRPAVIKDVFAA